VPGQPDLARRRVQRPLHRDVWRGGAFRGDYARFHRAVVNRMPANQTPKHTVVGQPSAEYDAERPFTI
jgi:hypothetical protein